MTTSENLRPDAPAALPRILRQPAARDLEQLVASSAKQVAGKLAQEVAKLERVVEGEHRAHQMLSEVVREGEGGRGAAGKRKM